MLEGPRKRPNLFDQFPPELLRFLQGLVNAEELRRIGRLPAYRRRLIEIGMLCTNALESLAEREKTAVLEKKAEVKVAIVAQIKSRKTETLRYYRGKLVELVDEARRVLGIEIDVDKVRAEAERASTAVVALDVRDDDEELN